MHTPAPNLLTAGEMDEPFHYRRLRANVSAVALAKWPAWCPIRNIRDCAALTPHTFQPRIHVIKGVNVSTATACRQCEDAPCANVCPNGAISRDKGFVHVMRERCIGCKTCVVACPYGAMEVVVRPVIRHSGAGLNVVAEKAEANECDLCFHRETARPAWKSARRTPWCALTATSWSR